MKKLIAIFCIINSCSPVVQDTQCEEHEFRIAALEIEVEELVDLWSTKAGDLKTIQEETAGYISTAKDYMIQHAAWILHMQELLAWRNELEKRVEALE